MDLTQVQLGEKLNLDSTYISQLESGGRRIDDWYIDRMRHLLTEFEKSKSGNVAQGFAAASTITGIEDWKVRAEIAEKRLDDLRAGLRSLLDLSGGSPSSSPVEDAAAKSLGAGPAILGLPPKPQQKQKAGEPTERKAPPAGVDDGGLNDRR